MPGAGVVAMVLAAGRGERMRPLTDTTPKPLLLVRGKPLMQWWLEALARAAVPRIVINTAWLEAAITAQFGNHFALEGSSNGHKPLSNQEQIPIFYSCEGRDFGAALETAGGIVRALPLLCPPDIKGPRAELFWLCAGDVFAPDFEFAQSAVERFAASDKLAHLWLVPNPVHNPNGDFALVPEREDADGVGLAIDPAAHDSRLRYTYSTIGLYRRQLFEPPWCDIACGNPHGVKAALAPLLRKAMRPSRVSAELYHGLWADIGTPERLQLINGART